MPSPKSLQDLQSLMRSIAALRRFIPQSSKRCLPMFEVIKKSSKSKKICWDQKYDESFKSIKDFLASPSVMARASPCEPLKIYLSASHDTIAAVLIKETNSEQKPVYYVSHMLNDIKIRYSKIEKLIFALIIASRKLRQYFQGRLITVVTNQPLRRILHKPDMTGRLASWIIELSQFNLEYTPRTSMRSQALSDFIVECNFEAPEEGGVLKDKKEKV